MCSFAVLVKAHPAFPPSLVNCFLVLSFHLARFLAGAGRPDANVGVRADSSTYQTAAIDPSSTLLVSGSLFVGTGLGLKKTCSPPGESAKSMLQRILKNHRDVATEAPPVTEDPSCAARERLSQHSA